MQTEENILGLWNNESRQKYFKVGSSDNPVDRFLSLDSNIKKQIALRFRFYYEIDFNGVIR